MLRIITSNLNGIRSAQKKGFFEWMLKSEADIVCVQELKAQNEDLTPEMRNPGKYRGYFHPAEKKGYSGVGIYSLAEPEHVVEGLGIAEIDSEGRYLQADYGNLSVISLYLPSGSSSDERQQVKYFFLEKFLPHLRELRNSGREVVICGDWNIAHKEIDLKNWKGNLKNSGFLPEERAWMTHVFDAVGWVDVYRRLHPEATGDAYTWWSNRGQARANNVGWRIDYQIATPEFADKAKHASVYREERFSDHAPLVMDYVL